MGIRIQFFFYFNSDPDLGQTLQSQKVGFWREKSSYVVYMSYFEKLEIKFIFEFWSLSLLLDPDPYS